MLKIHTSDGKTHRVDLSDEEQAKHWLSLLKSSNFQEEVTGVSVVQDCHGRIRCSNCKKPGKLVCQACGQNVPSNSNTKTGVQYSLSRPDGFDSVFYEVELISPEIGSKIRGGEKVTCFVGNLRATMMVHAGQPSVRVTLLKTGKRRYNPNSG